ncbi:hypothetical protein L0156_10335 [bacterium]|nr:hypothetical protein [bacterium]
MKKNGRRKNTPAEILKSIRGLDPLDIEMEARLFLIERKGADSLEQELKDTDSSALSEHLKNYVFETKEHQRYVSERTKVIQQFARPERKSSSYEDLLIELGKKKQGDWKKTLVERLSTDFVDPFDDIEPDIRESLYDQLASWRTKLPVLEYEALVLKTAPNREKLERIHCFDDLGKEIFYRRARLRMLWESLE